MIVIAIIAIIAAIAIPNLKESRKAAYEADAIATLRSIHTAQNLYRERDLDGNGTLDYSSKLSYLVNAGLVPLNPDGIYYSHSGYTFDQWTHKGSLFVWSVHCWPVGADPNGGRDAGDRMFFVDQSGTIRHSIAWGAGSPTWGQTWWPAIGK